jgi:hypothetical protein
MKLFLSIIVACLMLSCNDTKQKTIVGKWKPVDMVIIGLSETEKKGIIDSARLEFTADGKFINHFSLEKVEATYTVKDSTLETLRNSQVERYKIRWEGKKVRLSNEEGYLVLERY